MIVNFKENFSLNTCILREGVRVRTGYFSLVAMAMAFGAIGVLVRILVSDWLNRGGFPWGTLSVNVLGSLTIGVIMALQSRSDHSLVLTAIAIGFLGALTTFSTFSLDNIKMIIDGQPGMAFVYLLSTNVICLLFCFLGIQSTRWFF